MGTGARWLSCRAAAMPDRMSSRALTAAAAARELRVTPTRIRQWVAAGAPAVRRERPMLVEVAALRRWRAGQHAQTPELLGQALLDTIRRDCGTGAPAHEAVGIPARQAALLLVFAYDRLCRGLTGKESPLPLPEPVRALRVVAGIPADPL